LRIRLRCRIDVDDRQIVRLVALGARVRRDDIRQLLRRRIHRVLRRSVTTPHFLCGLRCLTVDTRGPKKHPHCDACEDRAKSHRRPSVEEIESWRCDYPPPKTQPQPPCTTSTPLQNCQRIAAFFERPAGNADTVRCLQPLPDMLAADAPGQEITIQRDYAA